MDTQHTLDLLAERASSPLEQAMSSPPSLYTDPAILDMEIKSIAPDLRPTSPGPVTMSPSP
jgi:hypothetical protein